MSTPPRIPPQPAAYLIDLDGTLIDTAPDLMRALNHALAQEGHAPADEALVRHWVGHGLRTMLSAAFDHNGAPISGARLDALRDICLDYYAAHLAERSAPYPGVPETLAALARRAPLAVVTNKPAQLAVRLLEALQLAQHFRAIVGQGTTPEMKPSPAPALHACGQLGVDAAGALFVGDSETDVLCARAAGCAVVLYRHGYNQGRDPETLGADAVIDCFASLLNPAPRAAETGSGA